MFGVIFNITSHKDFPHQILEALKSRFASIPKIRPKISAEMDVNTDHPTFDCTLDAPTTSGNDVKEIIQDVLSDLDKLDKI